MDKETIRIAQVFGLASFIILRLLGVLVIKDWCSNVPFLADMCCLLGIVLIPELIYKLTN